VAEVMVVPVEEDLIGAIAGLALEIVAQFEDTGEDRDQGPGHLRRSVEPDTQVVHTQGVEACHGDLGVFLDPRYGHQDLLLSHLPHELLEHLRVDQGHLRHRDDKSLGA